MVEMRTQLAIERAGLVTLPLQPARRSSIPTIGIDFHRLNWLASLIPVFDAGPTHVITLATV